ncbi:hypothetical protein [Vannielia sp. SX4]
MTSQRAPVLRCRIKAPPATQETPMNRIIYLVGLVVIVLAILSFIGLG